VPLTRVHADQLTELYNLGEGNAFSPTQVEHGVFYGVFEDGQLVSVAGTHLVSPTYAVAAVGNVFTHPDHRNLGYGTMTTSAVVTRLLQTGILDIILNVGQENQAAIRIYERLGFERHCPYLEGPARRRTAGDA
jgi:predicted GNAT family acetyltransferase